MKISVDFPELRFQRDAIGGSLSDWRIGQNPLEPRGVLLEELGVGIEIDLGDVSTGPGRLLTYKGEQILLYIKDTRSSLWTLRNEPENSRRFHVADCRTLERMRNERRFERFVATNRTDGLFLADWLDPDSGARGQAEAALKVCKDCLSVLNWRGYERPGDRLARSDGTLQGKSDIWSEFSILEFLMEYSTFFRNKPSRRDTAAALNLYVSDWPSISERVRRAAKWRCEKCKVDLSQYPGMLHCHHENGVVTDNSDANLRVLCALDHAEQPGHQHMKVSETVRRKIKELRVRQGIYAPR